MPVPWRRSAGSGACRASGAPGSAGHGYGSGFHEDGLQAGLAVAEALGGVRRPWTVAAESGRIHLPDAALAMQVAR